MEKVWLYFLNSSKLFFYPLIWSYFAISGSVFLNVAYEEARGLEWIGNQALAPFHYIFAGKSAYRNSQGEWEFSPRFNFEDHFAAKTVGSMVFVVPGFFIGCVAKGAALLEKTGRERFREIKLALNEIRLNDAYYASIGLYPGDPVTRDWTIPEGYKRLPGDESRLSVEKIALRDITTLLSEANINWWVDCGTCLGAYRYGGIIPWDKDIDIAVLLPDFDNVYRTLNKLDPMKYLVQDWSSRYRPKSYLRVFVRESNTLIDIYHFAIDLVKKEVRYVHSLEHAFYIPKWLVIRESRYKVPVAFETVFPLKKMLFDGIEVFVPNDIKKYLQRYYGENLAPAKLYNEKTGEYEKDLSHPYWGLEHAY